MPLEEVIIPVFGWVEPAVADVPAGVKLRPRGFAPRLSDSEVRTWERVGEGLGDDGAEASWTYFKRHWAGCFPGLGARSTFVRQAAQRWRIKPGWHERLGADLGARAAEGHISAGFPIAGCKRARAGRRHVLKAEADYGYWAATAEDSSGLKAPLLIDLRGVVVGGPLTAANVDEREAADDVLPASEGLVVGDKGYLRPQLQADCQALGLDLQPPVRQTMPARRPQWGLKLLQRVRQRIETVLGQLEQRGGVAKTRARAAGPLTKPVTRKRLAPTLGVWLNLRQGRAPLALEGVLAA